jgi:hypothetical protein
MAIAQRALAAGTRRTGTHTCSTDAQTERVAEQSVSCSPWMLSLGQFGSQLLFSALETVGDVLEEEQPRHDVLVLRGIDLPA